MVAYDIEPSDAIVPKIGASLHLRRKMELLL